MAKKLKPKKELKVTKTGYHPTGDEAKVYKQYTRRKEELLDSRKNVHGIDIDALMRRMDRKYFTEVADIPASELDPKQKPVAINNAFGKVQSALGILIDRNPEVTMEEDKSEFSANREIIKGLAQASFKNTNSLGQLKLSIFNCAKRGWFVGRTYYREIKHEAQFLDRIDTDPEGKEKPVWVTKEVTKVDDVAYVNLNNHNVWLDEQTVPEDFYSTRDWMWREVMHIEDLRRMFPKADYPNIEFVQEGGNISETIDGSSDLTSSNQSSNSAKETKQGMVEVFFYENQYDDWYIVEANGVMVCYQPLPQNHKRISCIYGYWNLRSAETIYGIGVVEAMEHNEELIDRIVNLTMRQLLLTIAPPGFYNGQEDPEDENMKYQPGTLSRVLDPDSIKFLEIPEGNQRGLQTTEWIEGKTDQKTGITRTLEGDDNAAKATAFETGVNREAGLKRLRLPMKSLQYALEWEFQNRISLIQQTYTDFQVRHIVEREDIFNYLDEIAEDPELFYIENEGVAGEEKFYAKEYKEMQLNLEQDDEGNYIETDEKKFFRIKPSMLPFEGKVLVDASTILVQSEELEKADTLRMANIVIPLITEGEPAKIGRAVRQLLIAYNKDPRKWLPDDWISAMKQQTKIAPNQLPEQTSDGMGPAGVPEVPGLPENPQNPNVVPPTELAGDPTAEQQLSSVLRT